MAYYYNLDFLEQCIGKGISLLDTFDYNDNTGEWETKVVSGESKIHDSLRNILSTRVGERFFMPDFGSRLYEVIYEQNDMIARDLAVQYTMEAIRNWEKRIEVDSVNVGEIDDDNIVPIFIFYHYKNSNVKGSYIYPFNLSDTGEIETYSSAYGYDRVEF